MRTIGHALAFAFVGLLAYGAHEQLAAASCYDKPASSPLTAVGVATYGIAIAGTFGYAEVAYGLDGEHLPTAWAWAQLVLAGVPWTYAGVNFMQPALTGCESHPPLSLGIGATAVGTWFIGDAVYSLRVPAHAPQSSGLHYKSPIALGLVRNRELTYATIGISF